MSVRRAVKLYEMNPCASVADVARLIDKPEATVRYWLGAAGVQIRSWSDLCRNRRDRIANEIVALYRSGYSKRELIECGYPAGALRTILHERHVVRTKSEARRLVAAKKRRREW